MKKKWRAKNSKFSFAVRAYHTACLGAALLLVGLAGCSTQTDNPQAKPQPPENSFTNIHPSQYTLDAEASGIYETANNIANLTVVSNDANVFKAEYKAGFVQGHIQHSGIISARDNLLRGYPSNFKLAGMRNVLMANYAWMISYLQTNAGAENTQRLIRLLFRMLGIYHGAILNQPANLDFSGTWLPAASYFQPDELVLNRETSTLSFMDVYFINASDDIGDIFNYGSNNATRAMGHKQTAVFDQLNWPLHCSAFVKRSGNDVIITHATWASYLAQTMAMTVKVNGDMVTFNAFVPGLIGSANDFGYNNRGMMFNETTNSYAYTNTKTNAIWIFWRAAMAEQFAGSIDEFFDCISLDNSGTYLNAYMLVDAKTNEIGLVDMSYKTFVLFRSNGGAYSITTKPAGLSTDYDSVMLTPDYIIGHNYPVSLLVREELQSGEYHPPRRDQLVQKVPDVSDLETAKAVITFYAPGVPDSIYGRFDIGTNYPSPAGAIDAKVANTSMAHAFMQLAGTLDLNSSAKGFWMTFGTAKINDVPFIWSKSQWNYWEHPDVPDVLDGTFTSMSLFLR